MRKKELIKRITELEAELADVTRQGDILIRDDDEDQTEIAAMRAEHLLLSALYDVSNTGNVRVWETELGVSCRRGLTRVEVNGRFIS